MTLPDLIAQAVILALILAALWHRDMLADMTDGVHESILSLHEVLK